MQKNLISAIAGWKSAALLALVAMVAAVAFSGVLSTTHTAEAADVPVGDGDNAATAAPGDTVQLTVTAELAQLTITGTADGVGASFVANDGQTISCADGNSCDADGADDASVRVDLKVDADAGEGHILVRVSRLGIGSPSEVTKVITVSKGTLVGSLTLGVDSKTIAASDVAATTAVTENETMLTVTVKNAATTPAGLNIALPGVTLFTTLGTISCDGGTNYAQACSIATTTQDPDGTGPIASGPGFARVNLRGGGVEGVATITATLGSLSKTVDVTMYGTAKKLTAEPQQGSIEIGGSVFVVLTVTDNAGNPVSGQVISPVASKEVVGPADDAVPVVTAKDATPDDNTDGSGYNMDLINARDATKNIPACGDDKDPVTDASATPPTTENFASNGTNDNGQCVVHVTAPKGTTAATTATRGLHTLNFQISPALKASAAIEVAGSPNSITTDAPARVEAGSVTEITVSVWDDTGVLVGITSVKTRKVDGGGLIEDESAEGTPGSEMTSNGQSKFTFIAPTNPGSSEILITAGTVNHRVAIAIGPEPEPEPEPEPAPVLTWSDPIVSGWNQVVWQGEDGASVADNVGDGVSSVHQWNPGAQDFNSWFAGAEGVPTTVNDFSELENGGIYWVYSQ